MNNTDMQRIADSHATASLNAVPIATLDQQLRSIRFNTILRLVGAALFALLIWTFFLGLVAGALYCVALAFVP